RHLRHGNGGGMAGTWSRHRDRRRVASACARVRRGERFPAGERRQPRGACRVSQVRVRHRVHVSLSGTTHRMRVADTHEALAARLGSALRARGLRVATAESCTGGMVAAAITAVAGSSEWFERGFVTYSNDAKCELLGVPPNVIEAHGAVSEAVARAMADGALARSHADCTVSVTG